MVAYLKRIDTGYEGSLTRQAAPGDIVNEVLDSGTDWSTYGFGRPVKYNDAGKIVPVASGDTADVIKGMLVRTFPGRAITNTGTQAYPQINGGAVPVARRGFMAVKLNGATTPAKGGAVYIRVAGGSDTAPVGGIEAAADATTAANTVLLPRAQFEGAPGADGITTISFEIL
ncbi:hypothetical protein K6W36_12390 [Acetobacter senegalensis]|uniref:structural cement protein Gp24 n=1 Tax=Acetobacter senegalensis TaxID=446692 RepID=UPI001EDAFC66|nr:hypothetical protein [Acetobacter senegalensis]MCG4261364.1 hypothetical protein [Acetobacter senegalensis]